MLITSDGYMPYAERAAKEFTFPEVLGAPVSGTQMYWYKQDRETTSHTGIKNFVKQGPAQNYYGGKTPNGHGIPNPFRGIMAQAWEEVRLDPSYVKECYLLGINRDLTRGGLPDAFFVIYLDCDFDQFIGGMPQAARDSWEWDGLPRNLRCEDGSLRFGDVRDLFARFLERGVASPPLITNMYLLLQHLRAREDNLRS